MSITRVSSSGFRIGDNSLCVLSSTGEEHESFGY